MSKPQIIILSSYTDLMQTDSSNSNNGTWTFGEYVVCILPNTSTH